MTQILFGVQSYQSEALQLSAQRLVNGFMEKEPEGVKSQVPIFGAPGLTAIYLLASVGIRGFWNFNGVLHVVAADTLYSVSSSGVITTIGSGISGTGNVSMADNGVQLIILSGRIRAHASVGAATTATTISLDSSDGFSGGVGVGVILDTGELFNTVQVGAPVGTTITIANPLPGPVSAGNEIFSYGEGFIYGPSTVFQQIVNINFYGGDTVLFFDGYFVANRPGTNEFYLSGLYDGLSWSGTDFASAEAQPGFLVAVAQNLQLLFLMCQNHAEMWYDAGSADFPFQRYAGGVIEKGISAPLTVINQDEALFFLGIDSIFYRLQGNIPVRVSTHAIEAAFQSYGDVSDASCMTFTYNGHKWIIVTFPSVPHTWIYDISTGLWHERESWDSNKKNLGRWRANCAIKIYDKILVGDYVSGQIWQVDPKNYTEGGNTIQLQIFSSPIHHDKIRLYFSRFELDVQAGVGLDGGVQGSDPKVMLDFSKDGGMTFVTLQPWRSMGKIGEYKKRQRWLNLGCAYTWVFRLTISDPVQRCIIAAHADIEEAML